MIQELERYLRVIWGALRSSSPELSPLRSSLRKGSYCVLVQVFDSTGSTHARVCFSDDGFAVEPGPAAPRGASWVVSRRYLADVLRRPQLYLQDPARLDLGWLAPPVT